MYVYERFIDYIINHVLDNDTDTLVPFIIRNKLQFILYDKIDQYIDEDTKKSFKNTYIANYIGERTRQITMSRLNQLLNENDISPVFFKGSVLAQQLYEDPFQRLVGDIDFFVSPDKIDKSYELLCGHGYSLEYEDGFSNEHHISLTNGQTLLELHREFISPYCVNNSNFLALRTRDIVINNTVIKTIDHTHTFLHLLLHQYRDFFNYFPDQNTDITISMLPSSAQYYYRIFEIALFCEKYDSIIDWSYIRQYFKANSFNAYMAIMMNNIYKIFPVLTRIESICKLL